MERKFEILSLEELSQKMIATFSHDGETMFAKDANEIPELVFAVADSRDQEEDDLTGWFTCYPLDFSRYGDEDIVLIAHYCGSGKKFLMETIYQTPIEEAEAEFQKTISELLLSDGMIHAVTADTLIGVAWLGKN